MNKIKKFIGQNKYIFLMLAIAAAYVAVLRHAFGITAAWLEIVGVGFAIIEFDLFRREKSSAFVFNIIKCVLLAMWFLSINLYGQVAFRAVFAVLNLAGLLIWLFPKTTLNKKRLSPSWLPRKISVPLYLVVFAFGLIMMFYSNIITTMDWVVVAFGTIGNLLIAIKKTDSWGLWLASDLIGLPLFFLTGSWMYLLMTVFMLCLEVSALRTWGKRK